MNSIGDVDNKLPTETSNKTGDESYSNGKEIEMNSNLKKMPKFKIDSDGDFYFVLSILPYLKRIKDNGCLRTKILKIANKNIHILKTLGHEIKDYNLEPSSDSNSMGKDDLALDDNRMKDAKLISSSTQSGAKLYKITEDRLLFTYPINEDFYEYDQFIERLFWYLRQVPFAFKISVRIQIMQVFKIPIMNQ